MKLPRFMMYNNVNKSCAYSCEATWKILTKKFIIKQIEDLSLLKPSAKKKKKKKKKN